jgi:phosphoenolpyruvate-protein kinase (PTS system EI component)
MLRSYHASQLSESGMNDSNIDLLQGRKPQSIARKSYIRVKRERLKEEYIQALPYLVVEDFERVKTELETVKEENQTLKERNEDLEDIKKRLLALEAGRPTWDEYIKGG